MSDDVIDHANSKMPQSEAQRYVLQYLVAIHAHAKIGVAKNAVSMFWGKNVIKYSTSRATAHIWGFISLGFCSPGLANRLSYDC